MSDWFDFLFGPHADSHTITSVQISTRAVLIFFVALALLRLSGPRTLGGTTAFDLVIKFMLGSVLSRAVVAASPFAGTIIACVIFIALHRILAWASYHYEWVDKVVKGKVFVLYERGDVKSERLRDLNINEKDLIEGVRENGNVGELSQTKTVYLERDGSISVVKKEN